MKVVHYWLCLLDHFNFIQRVIKLSSVFCDVKQFFSETNGNI